MYTASSKPPFLPAPWLPQSALPLQADFKLIKKRIEDLMQREYLERDRDNPNMIRYLA